MGDSAFSVTFDIPLPRAAMVTSELTDFQAKIQPLFESAGLKVEDNGTGTITVSPDSDENDTLTFECDYDGYGYKARGCVVSDAEVVCESKKEFLLRVTLQGVLVSEGEVTSYTTISYTFTRGLCEGGVCTLNDGTNSITSLIKSCTWKVTNDVEAKESITASKGIAYYFYKDREISMSLVCSSFFDGSNQRDDEVSNAFYDSTKCSLLCDVCTLTDSSNITINGKMDEYKRVDNAGAMESNITIAHTGTVSDAYLIFYYA